MDMIKRAREDWDTNRLTLEEWAEDYGEEVLSHAEATEAALAVAREAIQQAIYDLGIPHTWPVNDERWKAYRTLTAALTEV
jgi:predicted urease superfamily metal-dependent hydrolase